MTKENWHLSRSVSITQIVSLVIIAISFVGVYFSMDNRVSNIEKSIISINKRDDLLLEMKQDIAIIKTILKYSEISSVSLN